MWLYQYTITCSLTVLLLFDFPPGCEGKILFLTHFHSFTHVQGSAHVLGLQGLLSLFFDSKFLN